MTDKKYKNILREILEEKIPNTKRRDYLIENEKRVQQLWDEQKAFEMNRPEDASKPKFLATFPYPYMNGRLHLGHVFTISKAAFAVFYERLKGKNAIFPFSFHCTGMPIKASADKLLKELDIYGPNGPPPPSEEELEHSRQEIKKNLLAELDTKKDPKDKAAGNQKGGKGKNNKNNNNSNEKPSEEKPKNFKEDPSVFHSSKAKVQAKSSGAKTQWEIMRSLGLDDEEIIKFTDPIYWLHYFPPQCKNDLIRFGTGVDWRRSFITTDVNPFYDAFVRWQFETLKSLDKVKFGKRYSIYSPLDGQVCLDHDRSSGENVNPFEYTLIKMELLSEIPNFTPPKDCKVYLVPATLRPETMYGQTNCWIKPDGEYGAFQVNDHEVFICSDRSARNMAFQELSPAHGVVTKIASINGTDLLGAKLNAPLSQYQAVYCLPMLTISMSKGTGIVTSVPSDSPDDFAALRDLQNKEPLRRKFNLQDEWVMPFTPVPIIKTSMGDLIAPSLVDEMKIKSQNDADLLALAKDKAYTLGFTEGELLVGEFANQKVRLVKDKIRELLISQNLAVKYSEPEKEPVISRSGDTCVVALVDQWYITYGDSQWKPIAEKALENLNTYHDETRHMFENTLGWMNQWACSRSFGLGSKIPWDPQYLIESLSDSTIYMAYYTIAHLIQGNADGSVKGPYNLTPEQLNNAFWDHIFLNKEYNAQEQANPIDAEILKTIKGEFDYWYPLDLRVSGKDLVPNHLTFAIYNHVAIWPDSNKWIRSIRANGHLLLNALKMSKNTGNFLTLFDALDLFGADATRVALAESGDTLEDANFSCSGANKAVLSLYNALLWAEDVIQLSNEMDGKETKKIEREEDEEQKKHSHFEKLVDRPEFSMADRIFDSQINQCIIATDAAYQATHYREALFSGFFTLRTYRDEYRYRVGADGLNRALVMKFLRVQALLMVPITPHWSEKIWEILPKEEGMPQLIVHAAFPEAGPVDHQLLAQNAHLLKVIDEFRKKIITAKVKPTQGTILVAKSWPSWHIQTLELLQNLFSEGTLTIEQATTMIKANGVIKKFANFAMPLAREVIEQSKVIGEKAFSPQLPYDEKQLYIDNASFMERSLELPLSFEDEVRPGEGKGAAVPFKPVINFPKAAAK